MAHADETAPPAPQADEDGPFIPVEARPAVVEDLARTAWQVAEALRVLETPQQ